MNRRDFIKFLGVTAAGAGALPQQIEAFTAYYEANTPMTTEPLIAVDGIWFSGMAKRSLRVWLDFFPGTLREMRLGINAFGGVIYWNAKPDSKIIVRRHDLTWKIEPDPLLEEKFEDVLIGHVEYIDDATIRRHFEIKTWQGSLGA